MQVLGHLLAIVCESRPSRNSDRDEADLQDWIRAFELVPVNAYCIHVATNCLIFIEGVRIFDK